MTNAQASRDDIAGIILAGGRSRRMGREKALIPLGGAPVIAHVAARLGPQVAKLAVSANGDAARLVFLDAPALPDVVGVQGEEGPLAGVLTGLRWAAAEGFGSLALAPSDAPFLPLDLVSRLAEGAAVDVISVAESQRGTEPLFSLWPIAALAEVERAFAAGERSPRRLIQSLPHRFVRFGADPTRPDPFLNLNTPEDVETAERWMADLNPGRSHQ
jgi:molybdopterin-guanine dinucleotide biosynthesis protein A